MAVLKAKLPEHAGDMRLDGLRAETEADGDLDVRPTLAQLVEDTLLSGGQDASGCGGRPRPLSRHGATLAADPPNYITRSALRPEQRLKLATHTQEGRLLQGAPSLGGVADGVGLGGGRPSASPGRGC